MSALRSGQSLLRHPATAPLALLTVVSSLALNRATSARIEREDQVRHATQVSFLREQLGELTRRGGRAGDEDLSLLARRCIALGLDAHSIGIPAEQIPTGFRGPSGRLTWSQVLLGGESDGEGLFDKLKASIEKATAGLQSQFASADTTDEGAVSAKSAQTQEEQDEWEKALIASIASAEARETEREQAQLRAEAQRRDAYAREAREAYLAKAAQELAEKGVDSQSHASPPSKRRTMI